MTSRLIHPQLTQMLTGDFFNQLCALKAPVKGRNSVGEEIRTFEIRYDETPIPCRVGLAGGGERKGGDYPYLDATNRIALVGQFPDLTEEWIAVVDSQEYEILLVARDAEQAMTRLECKIIR